MNKKQNVNANARHVIASVAKQSLAALAFAGIAAGFVACGDDSSSSVGPNDDEEITSSSSDEDASSSSKKDKSSSSAKKDKSSSSAAKDESSSSVKEESSSSAKEESSSSVEEKFVASAVVFTSDWTTGVLHLMNDKGEFSKKELSFHQDSRVIANGSDLYVLERKGGDNITLLDPQKIDSEGENAVVWQISLDDESNPVDLAFNGEKAWVALQNADSLVQISTKDGKVLKSIKTGEFAYEGETSPYVQDVEYADGKLYVMIQRYTYDPEAWTTTYPKGLLAIYNAESGELLDTIQLATQNPSEMAFSKGTLYIATHGEYTATGTDADEKRGIEKVDLESKKSSLYIPGTTLGGGISTMVVEDGVAYVAIDQGMDASYNGIMEVKKVDLSSKKVESISKNVDLTGAGLMSINDGAVYFGDRTGKNVIAFEKGKTKSYAMPKGALPPYSITLL